MLSVIHSVVVTIRHGVSGLVVRHHVVLDTNNDKLMIVMGSPFNLNVKHVPMLLPFPNGHNGVLARHHVVMV